MSALPGREGCLERARPHSCPRGQPCAFRLRACAYPQDSLLLKTTSQGSSASQSADHSSFAS